MILCWSEPPGSWDWLRLQMWDWGVIIVTFRLPLEGRSWLQRVSMAAALARWGLASSVWENHRRLRQLSSACA